MTYKASKHVGENRLDPSYFWIEGEDGFYASYDSSEEEEFYAKCRELGIQRYTEDYFCEEEDVPPETS